MAKSIQIFQPQTWVDTTGNPIRFPLAGNFPDYLVEPGAVAPMVTAIEVVLPR